MIKKIKPYLKYVLIVFILILVIFQIERGKKVKTIIKKLNSLNNKTSVISSRAVKLDRFNNNVTDAQRKNPKPLPGGILKVRLPGNPVLLNPILSTTSTANMVNSYIVDSLVKKNMETLEMRPWLAKYWEIRDLVKLKNGQTLSGKIIKKNENFIILEPITKITFALSDIKTINKNKIILKSNKVISGKIKKLKETLIIETSIKGGKTRKIPVFEIQLKKQNIGGKVKNIPAVMKNSMFIFHIRKGIKWHDSTKQKVNTLTADDVIFSYKTIMNPYVNAQVLRSYFNQIDEVKKLGKYKVSFTYIKPYFNAFSICAGIPILPKHVFQQENFRGDKVRYAKAFNSHSYNRNPISCGPYKLVKWDHSKIIILKKFKNYWAKNAGLSYWAKSQPYLDEIHFIMILNKQAALKALLKKQIDADFDIEPSIWNDSLTNTADFKKNFVRCSELGILYTYIGYNSKTKFFNNKLVRQALTMLIPREKILKQIHFGLGRITTGPFYPKGPVYDHTIKPHEYNPEKAGELLTKAGWVDLDGDGIREKDGVKFDFEYLIHNMRDYHQRIADIIKEHVEQAGIKMTIRKLDWSIFTKKISEQKFDSIRLAWGMSIDPDLFQIFHSSQSKGRGSNYVNYNNPEADSIMIKARQTFDNKKRWALNRQLHKIMHEDQPYTFLFNLNHLGFYNKNFRGVKLYYSSTPYDFNEWYYVGKRTQKQSHGSYNFSLIFILIIIGGAVYFFIYKIKRIFNNQV